MPEFSGLSYDVRPSCEGDTLAKAGTIPCWKAIFVRIRPCFYPTVDLQNLFFCKDGLSSLTLLGLESFKAVLIESLHPLGDPVSGKSYNQDDLLGLILPLPDKTDRLKALSNLSIFFLFFSVLQFF